MSEYSALKDWHASTLEPRTNSLLQQHSSLILEGDTPVLEVYLPIFDDRQVWLDDILGQCPEPHLQVKFTIKRKVCQNNLKSPKNIKNIIPIYSTKGGVGKSTITYHIARCLATYGYKVGVLDADIYGPNQADLFADYSAPTIDNDLFIPRCTDGVHWMSMGLLNEGKAVIWRGPMASRALKQLLDQTAWPDLDFLLIDMPPGTGDIQLTLLKEIPIASSIVITTPDTLAYQDALKGLQMMEKLSVHIGGWINNMATMTCQSCQHQHPLERSPAPEALIAISAQTQLPYCLPPHSLKGHDLLPFLKAFFEDFSQLGDLRGGKIPQIVVK